MLMRRTRRRAGVALALLALAAYYPALADVTGYLVITAAKELLLAFETGHNQVPEQTEVVNGWLVGRVKGQ